MIISKYCAKVPSLDKVGTHDIATSSQGQNWKREKDRTTVPNSEAGFKKSNHLFRWWLLAWRLDELLCLVHIYGNGPYESDSLNLLIGL